MVKNDHPTKIILTCICSLVGIRRHGLPRKLGNKTQRRLYPFLQIATFFISELDSIQWVDNRLLMSNDDSSRENDSSLLERYESNHNTNK